MTDHPNRATGATPKSHRSKLMWPCAAIGSVVLLATVLMGCSSTKTSTSSASSTSTTSTTASYPADKQEVCQARDQLQTSVSALTNPTLLTKGGSAIKAAVTQVQTDVQSVKTAAKQDYQPQIEALQTSLQDLQRAAGDLGDGSIAQNMTAVGTAIASVGTNASALVTQLKTTCGS
jgi:hypothetical protein